MALSTEKVRSILTAPGFQIMRLALAPVRQGASRTDHLTL